MRNSRWSNKPPLKNGQIVGTKPNVPGDLELLKYLGQYTQLTNSDLAQLTGRPYGSTQRRTNKLKRKPLEYIKVADFQLESPRQYQWCQQVLQLAPRGVAALSDLGFEARVPKPSMHSMHSLLQNQTHASFEVGARQAGLKLHRLPHAPIPVRFDFKDEEHAFNLHPDGGPIVLEYPDETCRAVVWETDIASEPLTSSNRDRQAIERKFAAYLTVLSQGLYETHWQNVPNLYVLFTTTTQTRLNNMRELLASMSTHYLHCFRFVKFPTILSGEGQPPLGWTVTDTDFSHPEEN